MVKLSKNFGKYVDIRTDFGMKFYFGREENKELLIEFLNSLFAGEKVIQDLSYAVVEHDGDKPETRRVVFDLHCVGKDGEHFIVEMQRLYQEHFKDRAVFYTSRLISKLLTRGRKKNSYHLPEVYFIGILEFQMEKNKDVEALETNAPYFYDVALCDRRTHQLFYDKLGFKLISLSDFHKKPDELVTIMDQWLYLLKHLSTMDKLPAFLDKRVFRLIFDVGEISKLTKEEFMSYEASLKRKWDAESVYHTAIRTGEARGMEKGMEKGREIEKRAIALELKKMGIPFMDIAKGTGLEIEEIERLK